MVSAPSDEKKSSYPASMAASTVPHQGYEDLKTEVERIQKENQLGQAPRLLICHPSVLSHIGVEAGGADGDVVSQSMSMMKYHVQVGRFKFECIQYTYVQSILHTKRLLKQLQDNLKSAGGQVDKYRAHLVALALKGNSTDFEDLLPPSALSNLILPLDGWTGSRP